MVNHLNTNRSIKLHWIDSPKITVSDSYSWIKELTKGCCFGTVYPSHEPYPNCGVQRGSSGIQQEKENPDGDPPRGLTRARVARPILRVGFGCKGGRRLTSSPPSNYVISFACFPSTHDRWTPKERTRMFRGVHGIV